MTQELSPKLAAAKELIEEKNYAAARLILQTLPDDVLAIKWLASIDSSEPMPSTDTTVLSALHAELAKVVQETAAAEADDARYNGGLIKTLIGVHLQIIRTTKSLIEQRIHALESGTPMTLVVQVANPDEARASKLEQEFQTQLALVQQARADAARYTGGVVHSLKLSTVATHELTLANLRQQLLSAKYGLVLPTAESKTSDAIEAPIAVPPTPAPKLFEVVKIDTRVTETNRQWSRYAWRLTLRSFAEVPIRLEAKIEFQDAQGFIITDHHERGMTLPAGAEHTFTGQKLITAAIAGNVRSVIAKVKTG